MRSRGEMRSASRTRPPWVLQSMFQAALLLLALPMPAEVWERSGRRREAEPQAGYRTRRRPRVRISRVQGPVAHISDRCVEAPAFATPLAVSARPLARIGGCIAGRSADRSAR
jgi:hypothetical protein